MTGRRHFKIDIDGLERTFHVHIPAGYDGGSALPLVLVFHGAGGDGERAAKITGWDKKADHENFIVAFPNGTPLNPERAASFLRNPQRWNAGSSRSLGAAKAPDDVAFSRTVIDTIARHYKVDAKRIYATGFSNGAAMCWRLGVDLSTRIAAIDPVAGYLALPDPQPEKEVPAIVIACLDDPLIPIDGGIVKDIWSREDRKRPSVRLVVKQYAVLCGCPEEPASTSAHDGVTKLVYGPGKNGARVIFYTIAGAGHTYPGGHEFLSQRIVGKPTNKLNATDEIWNFFQAISL